MVQGLYLNDVLRHCLTSQRGLINDSGGCAEGLVDLCGNPSGSCSLIAVPISKGRKGGSSSRRKYCDWGKSLSVGSINPVVIRSEERVTDSRQIYSLLLYPVRSKGVALVIRWRRAHWWKCRNCRSVIVNFIIRCICIFFIFTITIFRINGHTIEGRNVGNVGNVG